MKRKGFFFNATIVNQRQWDVVKSKAAFCRNKVLSYYWVPKLLCCIGQSNVEVKQAALLMIETESSLIQLVHFVYTRFLTCNQREMQIFEKTHFLKFSKKSSEVILKVLNSLIDFFEIFFLKSAFFSKICISLWLHFRNLVFIKSIKWINEFPVSIVRSVAQLILGNRKFIYVDVFLHYIEKNTYIYEFSVPEDPLNIWGLLGTRFSETQNFRLSGNFQDMILSLRHKTDFCSFKRSL